MINQAGWITLAPLSDILEKNYEVSIYLINYLSQSFMILYLPMNQPAVIALDRKGLKFGLSIGIILTTLGNWLKAMINLSFWWVVIGQSIIAAG